MLGHELGMCKKTPSIKSVCEDIENNNSFDNLKNNGNASQKSGEIATQYSSNAKGILAQVRLCK